MNALMRLRVESSQANALLLCGIPFAEGAVEPGSGFVLLDAQEQSRPLWWEERAHWADGSIKWIFLHARLMGAEQELQLCVDAVRPATLTVEGASLSLDDMQVQFGQDLWALAVGGAGVEVQPGIAHASDVADSEAPFVLELVEPSPLAPLLRWHQQTQSGLRFDHLLRLDPQCGQIYWQQRLSFMDEDLVFYFAANKFNIELSLSFFTGDISFLAWPIDIRYREGSLIVEMDLLRLPLRMFV